MVVTEATLSCDLSNGEFDSGETVAKQFDMSVAQNIEATFDTGKLQWASFAVKTDPEDVEMELRILHSVCILVPVTIFCEHDCAHVISTSLM